MKEKSSPVSRRASRASNTNMDSFISCFHASSLNTQTASHPPSSQQPLPPQQEQQPAASTAYCYIPGHYWQTLDYYDMAMDICTDPNDIQQIPQSLVSNSIRLNFTDDFSPLDSPLELALDNDNSPGDSALLLMQTNTGSLVQGSPSAETDCPTHSRGGNHQQSCEICEKDKKEQQPQLTTIRSEQRRKEQNRKAQRNHRLRSEAKLEQLRAKVKSQSDEIASLREFNQSLLKHIETFRSKAQEDGDGDTDTSATDLLLQQLSQSSQ